MVRCRQSPLVVALVAAVIALSACGTAGSPDRSLHYSVIAHQGGLTATVADNRAGKHTVWVVLDHPPKARQGHRLWVAVLNHGELGTNESRSDSASGPLPAGTYSYSIYDAPVVVNTGDARYWTPQNRIAAGKVTVP